MTPVKSQSSVRPEIIQVNKLTDNMFEVVVSTNVTECEVFNSESSFDEMGEPKSTVAYDFDMRLDKTHAFTPEALRDFIVTMVYEEYAKYDMASILDATEYTQYIEFVSLANEIAISVFAPEEDPDAPNFTKYVALSKSLLTNFDGMSLSEAKDICIATTKENLADFLLNNPLETDVHNGIPKHYTVTLEKQQQLSLLLQQYAQYTELEMEPDLKWNATGESAEDWAIEDLRQLFVLISDYVGNFVEMQREKEVAILEASSIEELKSISLTY